MVQALQKLAKQVEDHKDASVEREAQLSNATEDLIPTGSTSLNLACSDNPKGGYSIGKLVNIIGDSDAGKTVLALSCLAECSVQERFESYRLLLDDVENALEIDIEAMFGESLEERIDFEYQSDTIENFCDNILELLDAEEPFIYILDSFDALTSNAEIAKEAENAKKRAAGKDETGSYGDGKAKIFSKFCRLNIKRIKEQNSAIIIISQTRDNIGFGAQFTPKIRSGGKALKFYATHEIWLACEKKIDQTVKGSKYQTGNHVEARVSKNKITGRKSRIHFPVLFAYGIDNITSCINYLTDHKFWKKSGSKITAKDWDETMDMKAMVDHIEKEDLESDLIEIVGKGWEIVADILRPKRKSKY